MIKLCVPVGVILLKYYVQGFSAYRWYEFSSLNCVKISIPSQPFIILLFGLIEPPPPENSNPFCGGVKIFSGTGHL